jgi:hypothetical protein
MADNGVEASQHNPNNPPVGPNQNPRNTNSADAKSHARKPSTFSGDRKTLEKFLQDCLIYISANKKDFQEERSGTQFIPSYIDGGEADSWKEFYVTSLTSDDGEIDWPTIKELTNNLRCQA